MQYVGVVVQKAMGLTMTVLPANTQTITVPAVVALEIGDLLSRVQPGFIGECFGGIA